MQARSLAQELEATLSQLEHVSGLAEARQLQVEQLQLDKLRQMGQDMSSESGPRCSEAGRDGSRRCSTCGGVSTD